MAGINDNAGLDVIADVVNVRGAGLEEGAETWHVPGFDGFGVQLVGKRPGQFTARFLRYAAHATVLTWTQDMQRQRSKECTITDGWPHTYTRIFIDEVVIREIIAVFPQGAMGEAYIVGRKRG